MLKITKNQGSIQVTADKSGFYPFDGTITFPTNSLFTATSANTDMITFKSTSNGDVQFVGNYKDITISGRSYDTKQKFLTAFSNLANQGSVDAYTKAETDAKIDAKQGKLKAGNGITLTEDATDGTTVVKTAVSLTYNGNGAYQVGDSIKMEREGIAIGMYANGRGSSLVAVGNNANGYGNGSVVVGNDASVSSFENVVIGTYASSIGNSSVAVGYNARANSNNSVAIGHSSRADADKPLVIRAGSITVDGATTPLTVLQSDANGKISLLKGDGTIERMVIQDEIEALKNAGGSGGSANPLVNVKGTNGDATIPDNITDAVVIGGGASVDGEKSVAIGSSAEALADNTVAIGPGANAMISKPLVIKAGINVNGVPLPMIQGDVNGKISIPLGDGTSSTMCLQDEIETLKNAGGGGAVDAYTKAETDTKLDAKQDKLTAGSGITITKDETAGTSTIATAVSLTNKGNGAYQVGSSIKMGDSIAIGSDSALPFMNNSIAIGNKASARGRDGIIIGTNAKSSARYGLSIGNGAEANDTTPLVIKAGYKTVNGDTNPLTVLQSDATGKLSILKGDGSDERIVIQDALSAGGGGSANPLVNVKGTGSATIPDNVTDAVAIGTSANSSGGSSIAIGENAEASNFYTIAIGKLTGAYSPRSTAIGYNAKVNGAFSSAIGTEAKANGTFSSAIGYSAEAEDYYTVSIGGMSRANKDTPLVIKAGYKTVDNSKQPLTVLQSDSNGKLSILKGDGTDTRMVIQDEIEALKNAGGSGGSANPLVNVKGTDSATITDTVTDAVAIGSGAKVTEELSVAIGAANALSGHCVAIGSGANATKMSSVAIGDGAMAQAHMFDVAIGFHAATTDTKPLEINAGYKTVGGATTPLTVLQSDSDGKLSILKGDDSDERIVISDEFAALKAEITTLKAEIAALKGGASTGA